MTNKAALIIILLFLVIAMGKECHAMNLIPLKLSFPENRFSLTTLDLIKSKTNANGIRLTLNEGELENCKFLKLVYINNNINFWQNKDSCELLIESLKKEVSFLQGNTLLVKPQEFECSKKTFSGYAYFCHWP